MGYYITHAGRRIHIDNFSGYDLYLPDIAHHLTKTCRFGGALDLAKHYSVARHSIELYLYAKRNNYSKDIQKALLMHDASEAYLGDIVSDLKHLLSDYKMIEARITKIIEYKYGIINWDQYVTKTVKQFDTRIVLDEAKAFFPDRYEDFTSQMSGIEPLGIKLTPEKDLNKTYEEFLHYCKELGIND